MTSLAFSAIVATAILYLNMLAVTQLIMSASAVQIDSAQDSVARHKASIALRSHAQKISALSLLPQSGGNLTSRYLIPDYLLQTYLLQTYLLPIYSINHCAIQHLLHCLAWLASL